MSLSALTNRIMNASFRTLLRKAHLIRDPQERGELRRIPTAEVQQLITARPLICVDGSYTYVDGSLPWCDIFALLSIVADRRPKSVVEIGTFNGHTTRLLAATLPNSQIHTIDLPPEPEDASSEIPKDDFHLIRSRKIGEFYKSDASIVNVVQHLGDTAAMDFPPGELYFIDGSHTYEYVKNDTEKAMAFPQAKTFLWHDCDFRHPGVVRFLRELVDAGFPVRKIKGTNLAVLFR